MCLTRISPAVDQSSNPASRNKLSRRPAAASPSTLPHQIASITDGFSFAYLKEAFIASLLTLVRDSGDGDTPAGEQDDGEWGRFGKVLQKQVVALREDIGEQSGASLPHNSKAKTNVVIAV